jgi:hypothetical protein
MQRANDGAHDAANYGKYIYDGQPQPPLSAAAADWAERVRRPS